MRFYVITRILPKMPFPYVADFVKAFQGARNMSL